MAEPRPFQFDSQQRSVGAAGGKRRIAWPWIALSLALHGALVLFALMGAARGGHTELLGTLEVSIVGAPSAGDPDSRNAEGEAETKPEPAALPRLEAPPATPAESAPVPQPSPVPQPAALTPAVPPPDQPKEPAKPAAAAPPPQAAPSPRESAAPQAAPNEPRPAESEPPKQPETAATPDPLALPRKAAEAEASPSAPPAAADPAVKRPETVKLPETPPAPMERPQTVSLPRAKAAPATATPAKAGPRAGVKQAPKGQTASLGTPMGGDRLGRSDSDDTAGLLNVNLNPRFRRPPAPPIYPRRSIERDEEGVVLVRALVDPSGAPQRVLIHKGSGFPLLDEAALKAVKGWRFEPMLREGRATAAWVQVPVRFRLN